ncbi:MAG: FAD-dependent oxidoreductase [Vicinamibacterales bacterium]
MTTKALIIGCGIGGPVAAMALQRAGIDAAIYEAHAQPADDVGLFLNVATNGLDALRTLDGHEQVLRDGFPTPRMIMFSGTGKRLGDVPNGGMLADGTTSLTIRRGLLHRALRDEAFRRGIRIEPGKRLIGVERRSNAIVARFEDRTSAEGDILVGFDGLHSRTREILDRSAPRPRYAGMLSLGGIARATHVPPTPGAYHMIFGARAFFGYSVPRSRDVYWFANLPRPVEPTPRELADTPSGAWKRELLELFAGDAGPAAAIVEATEDEIGAYPVHDLPAVPRWHDDRMVLAGDAAHATSPSSGQGASIAIEDALVLAKCLRDVARPKDAFAEYVALRRSRVERIVRYSSSVGRTKTAGPVARRVRDLVMPLALKWFASASAQSWMYSYHIDWNDRIAARPASASE